MRKLFKRRQPLLFVMMLTVVVLAAAGLAMAGCGEESDSTDTGGAAASPSAESHTIGVSIINLRDPDLAVMNDAMQAKATELGDELISVDSKGDTATELQQVEDLIARQVDAIILQPIDATQSQTAVQRANEANIPVFLLSTELAPDAPVEFVSYIGVDDTEGGRMQAESVNEAFPDGAKMIYMVGTYGASWTDRRKSGFTEVVNDNIEIVAEQQANGDRGEAKRIMEDLLRRYPSGVGVFVAHNDEMAIGATSAMKEAGRLDEFKIRVGFDGTAPGLEAISDGLMTSTILQRSADQGAKSVEVVNSYLNGQTVEDRYYLPFELVTADNVADYLQ